MLKSKSQNSKPSKAQRLAQSARDKQLAQARMGASGRPRVQAQGRRRGSNPGGVPPVAGFFAPVSEGTIMKSVKPVFIRNNFQSQRIVHREKVAKLSTPGTGAFTVLGSFPLNPGLPATFPWLSNEAQGWECYRFNRLRFLWVPTSGTAVAGNIIMAPDYDAADAAPLGETFISSYSDCEEANVWARFASDLESSLLNGEMKRHFIRSGPLGSNLDIKTYDSGNFFVCSTDDAAVNSGKLWVEYDIELFNPQVPSGGFQASGTLQGAGGSLAAATPFGAVPLATGMVGLAGAASNTLSITNVQVGQEISICCAVVGTVITASQFSGAVGMTVRTSGGNSVINAAQTAAIQWATYTVTAPNPTVNLTLTATTITASEVVATVLSPIPAF